MTEHTQDPGETQGEGHESSAAVLAALAANVGIAIAKFIGFLLSGASSMLAESVHSLADSGNEVLLLIGGKRARQEADADHPFGYGRARYVYAFVVSIILFSLGGMFALYEAYEKFHERGPNSYEWNDRWWWLAPAILLASIVMEGLSWRTAIKESNKTRGGKSWWRFIRTAKAPELPAVLLEDTAALLGLTFALAGVGLTMLTGDVVWDAAGTALIGLLLVVVAAILGVEMTSLLVGESAEPQQVRAIRDALVGHEDHGIDRVIHLRTMHLGPEELLVAAKIAVGRLDTAEQVAQAIDGAEQRVRAAVPQLSLVMYLEPDIDRGVREPVGWQHPASIDTDSGPVPPVAADQDDKPYAEDI